MSNAAGNSASAVVSQNLQERRLMGLNAFDRHQSLMKNAIKYYRAQLPPQQQTVKTDYDVLKEQYRSATSVAASAVLAALQVALWYYDHMGTRARCQLVAYKL